MLLDAIKIAVKNYIPVAGNKIKRVDHVNANDTIISELYYSDWGIPKPFFSDILPEGYVWCNQQNQIVNVSDCHPKFVEIMSHMYPVYGGDGITTIGIPYIPGGSSLVQIGDISIGNTLTTIELGAIGGAAGVTLTAEQSGSPAHQHRISKIASDSSGEAKNALQIMNTNTLNTSILNTDMSIGTNAAQAHYNMSPYFAVNYILRIK